MLEKVLKKVLFKFGFERVVFRFIFEQKKSLFYLIYFQRILGKVVGRQLFVVLFYKDSWVEEEIRGSFNWYYSML